MPHNLTTSGFQRNIATTPVFQFRFRILCRHRPIRRMGLSTIFEIRFHPLLLAEITSFSMTPLYQCSEPTSRFQSDLNRTSIELVHGCSYNSHHTCYKSQVFGRLLKPNVVYKLVYVLVAYIILRMLIQLHVETLCSLLHM